MTYNVIRVGGDYRALRSDTDGSESLLARALLNSHAVGDRVGAFPIEMLGANESPLREVSGSAANFNRANRRGKRLRRCKTRRTRATG